MKPETDINRRREDFPTLASGIHLLSHSLGPVPRVTRESMLAYYEAWEHHTSEDAWAASWWEMSAAVGDHIANILGGDNGSVQIQPNASIALSSVLSCFDFTSIKRNKIVASALDFVIGGATKCCGGGRACGCLCVRPDLRRELQPGLRGWVAHAAPFDFAPPPMRYTESVRRFAQGTPSIPALYSVLPGLQIIE